MTDITENIKPIFWGHVKWLSLFSVIAVYPDNPTKELMLNTQNIFKSMEYDLPCEGCRHSYSTFNKEKDTDVYNIDNFSSKDKLILLVWTLRNKVNNKLGVEYNITLKYFKIKLSLMVCDYHSKDGIVWNLTEAPFLPQAYESKILDYVDKHKQYIPNYKKGYTKELIRIMNSLIENIKDTDFDLENTKFKLWFKRNKRCNSIKQKIYINMACKNYDFIKSLEVDKILYLKLFYYGCCIIPKWELRKIFD